MSPAFNYHNISKDTSLERPIEPGKMTPLTELTLWAKDKQGTFFENSICGELTASPNRAVIGGDLWPKDG